MQFIYANKDVSRIVVIDCALSVAADMSEIKKALEAGSNFSIYWAVQQDSKTEMVNIFWNNSTQALEMRGEFIEQLNESDPSSVMKVVSRAIQNEILSNHLELIPYRKRFDASAAPSPGTIGVI